MTSTVRAAVASEIRKTEIREFPMPHVEPDSGLLRVETTGVCGSDWPFYLTMPKVKGPLILGHETVGIVEKLGNGKKWGVKEGDRVALEEYIPCGQCHWCYTGDFRLCEQTDLKFGALRYGLMPVTKEPHLWGGFGQYQHLHANTVFHKIPSHVPAAHAAMALPLGNGVEWAYLQGGTKVGDTVVIQGPGQQGLACVIAAKEAGASCIIVTGLGNQTDTFRLRVARELGAHHTINVDEQDPIKAVSEITNGEMANVVIDAASGGPWTVSLAVYLAAKKGRVILCGQKQARVPEFDSDILSARFLTVKGMRGHSYQAVALAVEIISSGRHRLDLMATHHFALDNLDEALRTVGGEGQPNPIHCTVNPWL